ncbi:hypothetical protein [Streptomyces caniscabiei]|uniref:hypothetical protein n=1 Tax=Streptomyces caniscabiei TaxID=2746961 RepID=UPI001872C39E|nr:hypothetical protein [Streptomyces caniscabiei]MBE4735770.1 hypothetical protein [Streptomyces caniscabiei]MBE4758387.1 hypothetical protein [Streptomyces caniscabiei]MBE4788478.1 hypothetical protein [Streptomyces caniscabiei]MDX2986382.1 hypothetical protein [Streptomyces caniscabiei]
MADQITVRRQRLLAEIRRVGGRYTTGQAHRFYRATGYGPCRTTARKDLQWWARRGALVETGTADRRGYWIAGGAA